MRGKKVKGRREGKSKDRGKGRRKKMLKKEGKCSWNKKKHREKYN